MDFLNNAPSNGYSPQVLADKLERYKTKNKKQVMTRESLIDFASLEFGLVMTMLTATDAILFCRGPSLDYSDTYQEDKLIQWMIVNLPTLRKKEEAIRPALIRRTVPNSLNTS